MLKKLSTVLMIFALFTVVAKAQWTYEGAWPDTGKKGGVHGVVVTPDGKIWVGSYYPTVWAGGGGVNTRPLVIYNPDGTLDDSLFTITTGGVIDTLGVGGGNLRGLSRDSEGNVYYAQAAPSKLIKINYLTRQGMARALIPETGSSPTKPGVADDGTVFVGPVVGGGTTTIAMYDADLVHSGAAVVGPPNIARTMDVSPDGLTIYWTMFTGYKGINVYQRPDLFSDFVLVDSLFRDETNGMSIESVAWNPATGHLWVSNDSRGDSAYSHLTWYGLDVTTNTLVDSFTLPIPNPDVRTDEYPRGHAFSEDGNTVYVGLFGVQYGLYKFTKAPSGIKEDPAGIVDDYTLSQNYPNPFNPTTNIKFSVKNSGFVTLKVYDMLGNEVSTLINQELNSGAYNIDFNASNLASGTYIYRLSVNGVQMSNKMMLLK